MSKKQFNELELQFQEECEVINLKYEYDGYNGDISWAIISNLTEDEILEKYRSIIGDYMPFIILPSAFGEVRDEYRRNEKKFQMRAIRNGLKSAFGLWTKNPRRKGEIRCLCSRCLEDYKSNPDYIVRRFDPFAKEKEKCDKCHRMGFEYIVREKQNRSFPKDEGKTDKA